MSSYDELQDLEQECDKDFRKLCEDNYGPTQKKKKKFPTLGRIKSTVSRGFKDINININPTSRKKTWFWCVILLIGFALFWFIAFWVLFLILGSELGWLSPKNSNNSTMFN